MQEAQKAEEPGRAGFPGLSGAARLGQPRKQLRGIFQEEGGSAGQKEASPEAAVRYQEQHCHQQRWRTDDSSRQSDRDGAIHLSYKKSDDSLVCS